MFKEGGGYRDIVLYGQSCQIVHPRDLQTRRRRSHSLHAGVGAFKIIQTGMGGDKVEESGVLHSLSAVQGGIMRYAPTGLSMKLGFGNPSPPPCPSPPVKIW